MLTPLHPSDVAATWARARGAVAACGAVLVLGCGGGSDRARPVLGAPAPLPAPANCAGAALSGLKSAVYVKAGGTDGPSCGTTTATACKTIQQGINNCAVGGCGVLVRHGLYPAAATITLRDSVSVYGSCLFDGEADRKYRSTVQGPADKPALSADSITTATTFQGFMVIAGDAATPGGASIAMTVSNSNSKFTMLRTQLVAGRGADGANAQDAGQMGCHQHAVFG